jgi:hypothetical protein
MREICFLMHYVATDDSCKVYSITINLLKLGFRFIPVTLYLHRSMHFYQISGMLRVRNNIRKHEDNHSSHYYIVSKNYLKT